MALNLFLDYLNTIILMIYIMIDKVFCISMKDCNVRRELMRGQLERAKLKNGWTFVDAVTIDSDKFKKHMNKKQIMLNYNGRAKLNYISQIAINLSHFECWQRILNNKFKYGIIIEDDVKFRMDFNKILETILTPDIRSTIIDVPYIIWLTGLKSVQYYNADTFNLKRLGPQYGNCMYLINHHMAKLLIDNFYPIKMPSDDFIIEIVNKFKVANFSVIPPVAYDLSSHYYKNMWSKEDITIKKNITRTSSGTILTDDMLK